MDPRIRESPNTTQETEAEGAGKPCCSCLARAETRILFFWGLLRPGIFPPLCSRVYNRIVVAIVTKNGGHSCFSFLKMWY